MGVVCGDIAYCCRSITSRKTSHEPIQRKSCLKGAFHCYNVFILVIGCAVLRVGIFLFVTDFSARKVTPIVGNQLYEVTTYLLIAGGGAVALLAFCGCCGTIKENKCALLCYGTALVIILILFVAACGLAFFFRGTLTNDVKALMRFQLSEHYGIDVKSNPHNRRLTEEWDTMQRNLQCCGVSGNVSSKDSWAFYRLNTLWFYGQNRKPFYVPDSCCREGDVAVCTGKDFFKGPPNFIDNPVMRETNPYLYTNGCYDKLVNYLDDYAIVIGIVSAVVPLFLILGIVISFCLCARVSGNPNDDEENVEK